MAYEISCITFLFFLCYFSLDGILRRARKKQKRLRRTVAPAFLKDLGTLFCFLAGKKKDYFQQEVDFLPAMISLVVSTLLFFYSIFCLLGKKFVSIASFSSSGGLRKSSLIAIL